MARNPESRIGAAKGLDMSHVLHIYKPSILVDRHHGDRRRPRDRPDRGDVTRFAVRTLRAHGVDRFQRRTPR